MSMNNVYKEEIQNLVAADFPWQDLSKKSILITGATGFIASFITHVLLAAGREHALGLTVHGLVRNRAKAERVFARYTGAADLRLIVQDVSEPLSPAVGGIDIIIHAASPASPKYYRNDPIGTMLPNVTGTMNLLEYARAHAAGRFLYLSSSEVYGRVPGKARVAEESFGSLDPLDLRSCYGESKRMGEALCLSWFSQHQVPVIIARLFHTYGPGMNLEDGRVFADFVANVVRNEPLLIKGDGRARRAFCYLTDAVSGLLTVLFKGECGLAYNIGDEESEISVKALAGLLAGLFPEKKLAVIRSKRPEGDAYLPSKVRRICPDTTRIRGLGWQPRVGLRRGFYRTVRSFSNEASA